jgi:hypothetical protein
LFFSTVNLFSLPRDNQDTPSAVLLFLGNGLQDLVIGPAFGLYLATIATISCFPPAREATTGLEPRPAIR